ncbi:MAG TPA: ChbG/HpnK family deacetylase [Terriglobales bacterium]|nr:ChbG/HpnK family deacetylase [Terriglobales bacterium]
MRRLVINADDFGLTEGINRGILQGHRAGVITSTTLMANGKQFSSAARAAHSAPNLSVGCHAVLVDGQPLLPWDQVLTLVKGNNGCTRLRDGFLELARDNYRHRIRAEEVEAEVIAQIRALQAAGIRVSHIDSHKHVHMLPSVCSALLRAARACGVKAVRNPFVPLKPLAFAHLLRRPKLWTRYTEVKVLRRYEDAFRNMVAAEGMVTTDGSFGVLVTGALDESLFEAIVGSIPEGTWEFVCHPGYNDAELDSVRTRLRDSREKELAVLTSPHSRELLTKHSVQLISYHHLTG